jgi:proline iminopeptidase
MQEHYITVNGVELFYAEEGSGPPCLLLHGGPGLDHHEFAPWLSPLASSVQLIYLDYRGNGRSQRISPEQFTTAAVVQDVEALRHSLGFTQMAVLGHSFGGFIALSYALAYPNAVSHLIISCSAPSYDIGAEVEEQLAHYGSPEVTSAFARESGMQTDEDMRAIIFDELPFYFATYPKEIRQRAEAWARETIYSAALSSWWGINQMPLYDVRPRLRELHTATLVIAGRHDRVCSLHQATIMQQGIPGALLAICEHSGHMPQMEESERYIQVVRDFLVAGR